MGSDARVREVLSADDVRRLPPSPPHIGHLAQDDRAEFAVDRASPADGLRHLGIGEVADTVQEAGVAVCQVTQRLAHLLHQQAVAPVLQYLSLIHI